MLGCWMIVIKTVVLMIMENEDDNNEYVDKGGVSNVGGRGKRWWSIYMVRLRTKLAELITKEA